ncbi:helix-turn-helix domain-containing protein [Heliomarina baculiformis]|uniref:helix-turn-helix domain-containing protein n=1 Tax=Heliomarina baculiformis TaxID=2872036 RepID=UPI001EE2EBDB|nr:helix-turn-helix transcriptional regulator [Heliomarina baculiformis]
MIEKMDKRVRAAQFRARLADAMAQTGTTQSELSRRIGVDRSTISQLLADEGARLPNAHVVGACASVLGVSADWLLSLSDRRESAAELMAGSLSLTEAPRALVDEKIFDWHKEAAGYKIRHVPASLPDMLKTRALIEWEYKPHLGRTADQAIGASEDRLQWMRGSASDYEICIPIYELYCFAQGIGYYHDLDAGVRREQIDFLLALCDQLYPRLRIYLFDAKRLYSAPITIFGPLLCVFYAGGHYMAFRDSDRIATFTGHFDMLVREADLSARHFPKHLKRLRDFIR